MSRRTLILTPEPPYPLHSGGAYRTASLVHYFARRGSVDLILFSESGAPALLPSGLVREQHVITLPPNSRSTSARYLRNARRAIEGIPPLVDRLSGFESAVQRAIGGRTYDFGLVEHFWCAPYLEQISAACGTTILDLHNIESSLHERCAGTDKGLQGAGHRRFARTSRRLEAEWMPAAGIVLATSSSDATLARTIAPRANVGVYPNALPRVSVPRMTEDPDRIVFSGNFEYHPNGDAVRWFAREIWPAIQQQNAAVCVRLVGKGAAFVKDFLPTEFEITGPVENALDEIAQAAVVIAPLRAGSGTRIKILEAWAAARAVVATPLAAEGLEAEPGQNVELASEAKPFAQAVVNLLANPERRRSLGAAGRSTFEAYYTWDSAWRVLGAHLHRYSQVPGKAELGGYTE